jgi:hypothetical protein
MVALGANAHPLWDGTPSSWFTPWATAAAAAGLKYIRLDMWWDSVASDANIANLNTLLAGVGLTPYVVLLQHDSPFNAPDPWAYAQVAKTIATKLPAGSLFGIWNEPNSPSFWVSPSATAYAKVAFASYHAIKNARPDIQVIVGELVFNDATYRQALLAATPLVPMDIFGIHPYTNTPTELAPEDPDTAHSAFYSYRTCITTTRTDLNNSGRSSVPIAITEIGFSTVTSYDTAARWRSARDIAEQYNVHSITGYHLGDRVEEPSSAALLGASQVPTPSWLAFTNT